jgi:transposase
MIYVGIDVAKDKHDCVITNSDGEILAKAFSFPNNLDGFNMLIQRISSVTTTTSNIKVGLEATGHYSYNILGFLLDKGFNIYLLNPLHTNLFRKSLSLRKTKTDKVDAHTITVMLMSMPNLKPYSETAYHNEELKSLTRYRFKKVQERAKLKVSISRLVTILFPELEKIVSTLHGVAIYALLSEFPSANLIANAHLTRLTNILSTSSKGYYGKETAEQIRNAARNSIGSHMSAKSLELKHTIKLIGELTSEINDIEKEIQCIMDEINSPILTIPGIRYAMGSMIVAEIGDFSRFDSPDKLLAYAGMSPSIYQSGKLESSHAHMEKRGSKYLRYALYNSAKFVCQWDSVFRSYLAKKRAEGKSYNVALSHVIRKLVRVIYQLEKTQQVYICKAA